jgi:hypothetical protein
MNMNMNMNVNVLAMKTDMNVNYRNIGYMDMKMSSMPRKK